MNWINKIHMQSTARFANEIRKMKQLKKGKDSYLGSFDFSVAEKEKKQQKKKALKKIKKNL